MGWPNNRDNLLITNYTPIPVGKTTFRGMSRVAPYISPGNQVGRICNVGKYPKENLTRFFFRLTTTGVGQPFTIDATELADAKSDVALYGTYGIKTVIAIRQNGITDLNLIGSAASKTYFADAVARLANEFYGNGDLIGFEVGSEWNITTASSEKNEWAQLKLFYEEIVASVRKFDPKRYLFLQSGGGAIAKRFKWITPLTDEYVGYSYHMYEAREITHQNVSVDTGAGVASYPSTTNYGGLNTSYTDHKIVLNNIDGLRRYLEPVKDFADKYGMSTWCLEFSTTLKSPGTTMTRWTEDLITALEEVGSNWCYWGDFQFDAFWGANHLPNHAYRSAYYPWSSGNIDCRTPACVLINGLKNNTVFGANLAVANVDGSLTYKYHTNFDDGASGIYVGMSGVGTIVKNATANPKSGTTHGRFTSAAGASDWTMQDTGGYISNSYNKSDLSFDFYLSVLPTSLLPIVRVNDEGVSLPAANYVVVSITTAGKIQIDTNSKVYVPEIPVAITAAAYHNLRVVVYAHATLGSVYVYLNGDCIAVLTGLVLSVGGRNAYKSMIRCNTSQNPLTIDIDNYKLTEEII